MIRLVICDDHQIVVEGLESMLEKENWIKIIGTANNFRELKSKLKGDNADILLTDLNMPGKNGLEMIQELKVGYPRLKIVALTMYYEKKLVDGLKEAGIDGFLMKNLSKDELLKSLEVVSKGGNYEPEAIKGLNSDYDFSFTANDEIRDAFISRFSLGPREIQVFLLVALGKTSKEISDILQIGLETVNSHRKSVLHKTDTRNSSEVTLFAVRHHLI